MLLNRLLNLIIWTYDLDFGNVAPQGSENIGHIWIYLSYKYLPEKDDFQRPLRTQYKLLFHSVI